MKRLSFIFVFLLTFTSHCFSQGNVRFTYDASGNRISRTIVLSSKRSIRKSESSAANVITDLLSERKRTIVPNTTNGYLKVIISGITDIDDCSLSIYSGGGQLISDNQNIGESTDLDLSNHPNSYYILKIRINDEISSWKIIKK